MSELMDEEQSLMSDTSSEKSFPDLKKRKVHNENENQQGLLDASPRQLFIQLLTQVRDNPDTYDEMVDQANSLCDKLDYGLWSMALINRNQSFAQACASPSSAQAKQQSLKLPKLHFSSNQQPM